MRYFIDLVSWLTVFLGWLLIWSSDNVQPHAPQILGPVFGICGSMLFAIGIVMFIKNPERR
jgi:drug/metabolite transporter (DMT)-like permease